MKSQQNPYLLRAVDWNEVFPWLILRKSLRFGFSLRLLTCVTLNLVVCIALFSWAFSGWTRFSVPKEHVFPPDHLAVGDYSICQNDVKPFMRNMEACNDVFISSKHGVVSKELYSLNGAYAVECNQWNELLTGPQDGVVDAKAFSNKVKSLDKHFSRYGVDFYEIPICYARLPKISKEKISLPKIVIAAFLVLNFFAIQMVVARMTTVRIATGVRPSLIHAMMMARKHIVSAVIAAVLMGVGVALVLAPVWVTALLPEFFTSLATPISLLFAFMGVFMILGTVLGLPLMLSALMSENSDYFDAMSRAYSYSLQRPLRYGFYLLVGLLYGILGRLVMCGITWGAVALFFWASGKNPATEQNLYVWFFVYMAGLLPLSFTVIYVCSLFSGIYMLLRRDVDAVEMDEVWLPKSQGVPLPELPQLKSDPRE